MLDGVHEHADRVAAADRVVILLQVCGELVRLETLYRVHALQCVSIPSLSVALTMGHDARYHFVEMLDRFPDFPEFVIVMRVSEPLP